jgi:ribosome-binding ATPase
MQLGIIGLPACGKTTIFNALTGSFLPVGQLAGAGRVEVHTATVNVPDDRLQRLSEFYQPKKTTNAQVTFADIGGLKANAGADGLPGQLINELSAMDGFLHVVRCFDDPNIPHPSETIDPLRDVETMESEFLLNDMLVVERRLEKLSEERKKSGRDKVAVEKEIALFERLADVLGEGIPLRGIIFSEDEVLVLSGFGLLSRKPLLIAANLGEGDHAPEFGDYGVHTLSISLKGQLEMEIAQLPIEEAQDFLDEYEIDQPGSQRVIRASYDLLGKITFFTVGEDEVRAWTIDSSGKALDAADTIHSDLARGFIRAEVIAWDKLIELNGLGPARTAGQLRIEGKQYSVQDGEVVHIRFNV